MDTADKGESEKGLGLRDCEENKGEKNERGEGWEGRGARSVEEATGRSP